MTQLIFTEDQLNIYSQQIIDFLSDIFKKQQKKTAVLAVSGGIDSALALTLLSRAIDKKNIHPVFLPYHGQSTTDSQLICRHCQIPETNWLKINIGEIVDGIAAKMGIKLKVKAAANHQTERGGDALSQQLAIAAKNDSLDKQSNLTNKIRLGNIMARVRMIVIYDLAKRLDALVCGTENKSEKYLGYYTRFGDEASDIEPIAHLYKTQVRQLAKFLKIPEQFISKAPSAGLWPGQTDEGQLGFSYKAADQILEQLIDMKKPAVEIKITGVLTTTIKELIERVEKLSYKQVVPYRLHFSVDYQQI